MRVALLAITLAILMGCAAQGYVDNYVDALATNPLLKARLEPTANKPVLYNGSDIQKDAQVMMANGFVLLGYSSFVFRAHDPNVALGQAKKVGASVVLHYSKYVGTVSGAIPFTTPTSTTSVTSVNGTAAGLVQGRVGYTPYSGSYQGGFNGTATTTTYGSQTTYIPFSVQNYEVVATFWGKLRPPILGVHYLNAPVEIAQKLGQNGGVIVSDVTEASPAFFADVLPGDVILSMNGQRVFGVKQFSGAIYGLAGKVVVLKIYRSGQRITKIIQLNK